MKHPVTVDGKKLEDIADEIGLIEAADIESAEIRDRCYRKLLLLAKAEFMECK